MKKDPKSKKKMHDQPPPEIIGINETQPISQPDSREDGTNVAIPNDANVQRNKNWVDENQL